MKGTIFKVKLKGLMWVLPWVTLSSQACQIFILNIAFTLNICPCDIDLTSFYVCLLYLLSLHVSQ